MRTRRQQPFDLDVSARQQHTGGRRGTCGRHYDTRGVNHQWLMQAMKPASDRAREQCAEVSWYPVKDRRAIAGVHLI